MSANTISFVVVTGFIRISFSKTINVPISLVELCHLFYHIVSKRFLIYQNVKNKEDPPRGLGLDYDLHSMMTTMLSIEIINRNICKNALNMAFDTTSSDVLIPPFCYIPDFSSLIPFPQRLCDKSHYDAILCMSANSKYLNNVYNKDSVLQSPYLILFNKQDGVCGTFKSNQERRKNHGYQDKCLYCGPKHGIISCEYDLHWEYGDINNKSTTLNFRRLHINDMISENKTFEPYSKLEINDDNRRSPMLYLSKYEKIVLMKQSEEPSDKWWSKSNGWIEVLLFDLNKKKYENGNKKLSIGRAHGFGCCSNWDQDEIYFVGSYGFAATFNMNKNKWNVLHETGVERFEYCDPPMIWFDDSNPNSLYCVGEVDIECPIDCWHFDNRDNQKKWNMIKNPQEYNIDVCHLHLVS